ncbi:MAG: MFS transporter [marine benthic group bacterium]|nr:MFS transporter [Gemmatimonadota bacterium]
MRERESSGGPLDRVLRLFTDVRSGEGLTVLLLAMNVFLLLTAYYFIKPLREALILDESGAEIKSYASALQALILLVAVPAYGALAGRWPRSKLINRVTLFFAACLVLFFFLGRAGLNLGVVFFLWVGIFNLMVIAQFWAFANDLYTNDQGERLFPLVQFGASAGAVFGSVVVGGLIEPLGIWIPMLIAAGILLLSLLVTGAVERREHPAEGIRGASSDPGSRGGSTSTSGAAGAGVEREKGGGAFSLVFRSRYLLLIALLVLFMNWVNTTGEYILGSVVEDAARGAVAAGTADGQSVGQYIGSFYSDFFAVVNVAGLLLQLFVVSRIVKYLGIRIAILFLPIIALGSYGLIAFLPVLGIVRWAKTAENSTDYSLQNTVRQTLFLPLTRDQKYKAKQAIDAFFWRAGDVLSALLVWVGTTWLALDASGFAKFNIMLVLVWLGLSVAIGREYTRRVKDRSTDGSGVVG